MDNLCRLQITLGVNDNDSGKNHNLDNMAIAKQLRYNIDTFHQNAHGTFLLEFLRHRIRLYASTSH